MLFFVYIADNCEHPLRWTMWTKVGCFYMYMLSKISKICYIMIRVYKKFEADGSGRSKGVQQVILDGSATWQNYYVRRNKYQLLQNVVWPPETAFLQGPKSVIV